MAVADVGRVLLFHKTWSYIIHSSAVFSLSSTSFMISVSYSGEKKPQEIYQPTSRKWITILLYHDQVLDFFQNTYIGWGERSEGFRRQKKASLNIYSHESKLKSVFWTTCTFSNKKTISRVIRHGDEATGTNYTIYLEHLGGFLPILKGKKTSKLKPEFVIFDPLKGTTTTQKLVS